MLAYTSAKNFLDFLRTLHLNNRNVENTFVEISVLDRGKWGEAKFALPNIDKNNR